jgi:enamine deaminase RidA (YjgF/YER057c/UK114 family)
MTNNARFLNPDTVHKPVGYSHIAEVTGGRLFYLAGQVAFDHSGKIVGEGDIAAQTRQVFENIKANLAAVNAGLDAVIKLTYFVLDPAGIPAIRQIRDEYVNTSAPPASTLLVVAGLALPEFLIEIEAVAALPS